MIKQEYKDFSLRAHRLQWRRWRPNTCQIELTFGCGLHCRHCYTDCYNIPAWLEKELGSRQVKDVLDQIRAMGVVWVCFTGGDPLSRPDFLEIYEYARRLGFLVTIFTNAFSMTAEIARVLARCPPFSIEVTLNAATKSRYEMISQVPGSFEKTMRGIRLMRRMNLPLKIKTLLTRDNVEQAGSIKKLVQRLGVRYDSLSGLFPRLDGDRFPCSLRLPVDARQRIRVSRLKNRGTLKVNEFFPCAVKGGDGFLIDPGGRLTLCRLMRDSALSVLSGGVQQAYRRQLRKVRRSRFTSDSLCKTCGLRAYCDNCPGRAYLETGDPEAPVPYYCLLAADNAQRKERFSERNCDL